MIKLKNRLIIALFLFLLIIISGCKGKKDVQKAIDEVRTGTEGLKLSFLPNAPPEKIHVGQEEKNEFDVELELKNKGAYPQPNEGVGGVGLVGKVYLSGYDPKIIRFESKDGKSGDLSAMALEGRSTLNPNGGQDILSFKGIVDANNLNVERYEPTLLATACYNYFTVAGPPVCIDPNPYSTIKEKKVCEIKPITLSSQGAPIAVTKIDEEAFATKTTFRITIKNVGNGDVIKYQRTDKCDPSTDVKLVREDIDKVYVQNIRIANRDLRCGPFAESTLAGAFKGTAGFIRLINGEGAIICDLPKEDYKESNTAYTTPLNIVLAYAYRNTVERKMQIRKEIGELGGGFDNDFPSSSSSSISSQPSNPPNEIIIV